VRAAMNVRMNPNKARRASRIDSALKCGSNQVPTIVSLPLPQCCCRKLDETIMAKNRNGRLDP
jgi:hypothetical protein